MRWKLKYFLEIWAIFWELKFGDLCLEFIDSSSAELPASAKLKSLKWSEKKSRKQFQFSSKQKKSKTKNQQKKTENLTRTMGKCLEQKNQTFLLNK